MVELSERKNFCNWYHQAQLLTLTHLTNYSMSKRKKIFIKNPLEIGETLSRTVLLLGECGGCCLLVLYRQDCYSFTVPQRRQSDLLEFKVHLAKTYSKTGKDVASKKMDDLLCSRVTM